MDDRTRLLLDKVGMVVGLALVLLALVGELLGWWNDLGVVLAAAGLLLGAIAAIDHNGREVLMVVRPLPAAIAGLGRGQASMLFRQDRMLEKQDQMLEKQDSMLEKQDSMLEKQDQMLEKQDHMLEKQDATNRHLARVVELLDERLPRAP